MVISTNYHQEVIEYRDLAGTESMLLPDDINGHDSDESLLLQAWFRIMAIACSNQEEMSCFRYDN